MVLVCISPFANSCNIMINTEKTFETEIGAATYYDEEIIKMFQLHNAGTPLLNFPEKLEEYLDTIKNKGQLELKF